MYHNKGVKFYHQSLEAEEQEAEALALARWHAALERGKKNAAAYFEDQRRQTIIDLDRAEEIHDDPNIFADETNENNDDQI